MKEKKQIKEKRYSDWFYRVQPAGDEWAEFKTLKQALKFIEKNFKCNIALRKVKYLLTK